MTEISSKPFSNRTSNIYKISSIEGEKQINEDIFPIISQGFSIKPRLFIAAREGFFHQGIFVEHDSEIVLKEKSCFPRILSSQLTQILTIYILNQLILSQIK